MPLFLLLQAFLFSRRNLEPEVHSLSKADDVVLNRVLRRHFIRGPAVLVDGVLGEDVGR